MSVGLRRDFVLTYATPVPVADMMNVWTTMCYSSTQRSLQSLWMRFGCAHRRQWTCFSALCADATFAAQSVTTPLSRIAADVQRKQQTTRLHPPATTPLLCVLLRISKHTFDAPSFRHACVHMLHLMPDACRAKVWPTLTSARVDVIYSHSAKRKFFALHFCMQASETSTHQIPIPLNL